MNVNECELERGAKKHNLNPEKAFGLRELTAREFISSGMVCYWNYAIRHQIKETLTDNGQLS